MPSKNIKRSADEQILEGSRAIALTIKNIAPDVISAYPITPQTHIVEDLAKFKAEGLADYEYIRAESEFAAASIVLGASAAGSRVYTASSSQGLLLMAEVLYNISGMRLPIVMTCANRAVSAPINIWNDHSDAMMMRDSGWLQLFAENHQEAVYQHLLAYKIAENLSLPVAVNVDGFILTHSYEPVKIPAKNLIKKFLPDYRPAAGTYLDPENPVTMGGFFPAEAYFQTRKNLYADTRSSLKVIKQEYARLKKVFSCKNSGNGLVELFGEKKADTLIIAMGSLAGTIKTALAKEKKAALLKITAFRPFPAEEIRQAAKNKKNIIVVEKAISPGSGGILGNEVKSALFGLSKNINIKNYIAGLGGRDISEKAIISLIKKAGDKNKQLVFLD